METHRIFTAVNLSLPTVRRLTELQRVLTKEVDPSELKLRWVPPANIHVTLKFYGTIRSEQIEAVRDAARRAAREARPFEVTARGLGVFPDASKPRVLWVGLQDPGGELAALQERVEASSVELGFAADSRPFHPHLTLARIKRADADISELLEQHAQVDCLASTIKELVIYESRLHQSGAEYVSHDRVALGARP